MFNVPLLFCLVGSIALSGLASGMLRRAAEGLAPDARDRIFKSENRRMWVWRIAEWAGIALILLGMFLPQMMLFTAKSQRVLVIAAGLALFCLSNAAAAWSSHSVYASEAPDTSASRAAFRAAALVTLGEAALLAVVFWIVSERVDLVQSSKAGSEAEQAAPEEKALWIDESIALKELAGLDRDYIEGRIEGGSLRTKSVAGRRMFHAADVAKLKNERRDKLPE